MEDRVTLAFGSVEDVWVVIHRADPVAEEDWRACIDEVMRQREVPHMLWVPGPALPDVGQRNDVVTLFEKHGTRVALMSDEPGVDRSVVALGWAGMKVARFGLDDVDGMLRFLSRTEHRARIASTIGPYLDRTWTVRGVPPRVEPRRGVLVPDTWH